MAKRKAKRVGPEAGTDDRVIRAVTIPVSMPLTVTRNLTDRRAKPELLEWPELEKAMKVCWETATDLANWCVVELYLREPRPCPRTGPFPPPPTFGKGGLYRHAFGKTTGKDRQKPSYPATEHVRGAMRSAEYVVRDAERRYRQIRHDVLRRGEVNLLRFRYPFPFPFRDGDWRPAFTDDGFPMVSVVIPTLGKVCLRLKRGPEFRRQIVAVRQMMSGEAKACNAALYKHRKGGLLFKMVGRFPRQERKEATNAAFVYTDPAAMLVVEVNGRRANVTNADHIKREIAKLDAIESRTRRHHCPSGRSIREQIREHKVMIQRTGEDKKREVRMDRKQRRNLEKHVATRCDKQHNRLDTYIQQVARQVARMCQRQCVGIVAYDDSIKTFMPDGFPWHQLKTRLHQLLAGEMSCDWIDGEFVQRQTSEEKQEWLAIVRAVAEVGRKVVTKKRRPSGASSPAVSVPCGTSRALPSTRSNRSSENRPTSS